MSDRQIYSMAAVIWVAAWIAAKFSIYITAPGRLQLTQTTTVAAKIGFWVVIALCLAAAFWSWRTYKPVVFICALVTIAAFNGFKSAHHDVVESRTYQGWATLKTDPVPTAGGVETVLAIDGHNYRVRAWGSPAGWLRHKLAGEKVQVDASLKPLDDPPLWLRARGIDGRATLKRVHGYRYGSAPSKLSNWIRRKVEKGARSMGRNQRALYTGLVYGDDRFQSDLAADEFDAAGLSHLVAVSGQNIVFVLAIAGPILRRCSIRARFVLVIAILIVFATMTRFEPSVVRASTMSTVAALSVFLGVELSAKRTLALALTLLICIEPLIVQKVGFQLSVAASIGIMFWAKRFTEAIPGPRTLAEMLAVTSAAQLAVSPLLLYYFGSIPVASLPANLAAGPAAGPVMMWGLTGGLITAWLPDIFAKWLTWLPELGVRWIQFVSGLSARFTLGNLGWLHIITLGFLGVLAVRLSAGFRRNLVFWLMVIVLAQPGFWVRYQGPQSRQIGWASALIVEDENTLLWIDGRYDAQIVLAGLRESTVRRVDVIVVEKSSYGVAQLIKDLSTRIEIGTVFAPTRDLGVSEIYIRDGQSEIVLLSQSAISVTSKDGRLSLRHTNPEHISQENGALRVGNK